MSPIYFFDLLGTVAFAISGSILGRKKEMDIYGVFILSLMVAVGGGTIRDIMLGKLPFILSDSNYIYCTLFAVFLVIFFYKHIEKKMTVLLWADSVGLGTFTVIGALKASEANLPWHGVIILSTLTATGGGVIRDLLAGDIPFVLKREIYASASILGAIFYLLILRLGFSVKIDIILTSIFVMLIRLVSVYKNIHLPIVRG